MGAHDRDGPIVKLMLGGIKCDAPGCDYFNELLPREDESYESYLGRPCPKCGAALLTEADLKNVRAIYAIAELANSIGTSLGLKTKQPAADKGIGVRIEMDGTGSMTFTPRDPAE